MTLPLGKTQKIKSCIGRKSKVQLYVYKEKTKKTMKRYGNLYKKICDIDNLRLAHQNARRGKGWYKEVREVDENLQHHLELLQEMLINHTYKTSKYEVFYKDDGDKVRKIYKLPYFPDRICQWAILQVIEPYLLKNFTADTYSAIPNMGIHKGLNKLKKAMWGDTDECRYCLKLDVKHYYQSINHEILKQKYSKLFKDKELLWLLNEIIDSVATAEIEDLQEIYLSEKVDANTGIPIGNYLSQYSGNYYLSSFDHWIKEEKKVKYYFRYMDDIVIFGRTKEELRTLRKEIAIYFNAELKLQIKDNWQIFPAYIRGVDFLGYRTFFNYSLLRKSTCKVMKQKMTAIKKKIENGGVISYSEQCCINSYKGWLKHCDSFRLQQKYITPLEKGENMIDYGVQRSTVKPDGIEITESKVFVYSDIKKISERDFLGYEFILQEYSKDEFIQAQVKKTSLLEKQMKDMQSAFIENVD